MVNWHDNLFHELKFDDANSGYSAVGKFWKATSLYAAASEQGCKPYRLPLRFMDLAGIRWNDMRIADMTNAVMRINNTDLKFPILISPVGGVIDGYHRIVKALVEKREYIMALRLLEMPEPDEEEK